MYNFRRSTLDQLTCRNQIYAIKKRLSTYCNNINDISSEELQQVVGQLLDICKRCPVKNEDCQLLLKKCKRLQLLIKVAASPNKCSPRIEKNAERNRSQSIFSTNNKDITIDRTPMESQSIFADCDPQWLQLMIDSFIADDCNSTKSFEDKLESALADDVLVVSQLSQKWLLSNSPITRNSQKKTTCSPYIPTPNAIAADNILQPSSPQSHSSQKCQQLVVLSHNDIMRLAEILQLNPDTLSSAIDALKPRVIQPASVEFFADISGRMMGNLAGNVQPSNSLSSEGSAISATPPSKLR